MPEVIVVIAVLLVILIVSIVLEIVVAYKKESNYIKMELSRACSHREREYWRKQKKKLVKRYLPFLYLFDKKKK